MGLMGYMRKNFKCFNWILELALSDSLPFPGAHSCCGVRIDIQSLQFSDSVTLNQMSKTVLSRPLRDSFP